MDELELLSKIRRMVKRHLHPNYYDVEDIATEIWIELYEKHRFLSNLYVKNRCIDKIRRATHVSFFPLDDYPFLPCKDEDLQDATELVNLLMERTFLSTDEKKIIYTAFYRNEKVPTFLLDKIIKKLRKELELLQSVKKNLE